MTLKYVLSMLVTSLKCMEVACRVLYHFAPVYVLQVSKNDDEEHIFLKRNLALLDKFDTF